MSANKTEIKNIFSPKNKAISLLFFGLFWVFLTLILEAFIDMAFEGEHFFEAFFMPSAHEMAIRTLFTGTLILFILYIASNWHKRDRLENSLQAALDDAQNEKRKSEAILEVIGDAISIQDLELKILYQNRAHIKLMGDHQGETCYSAYQKKERACDGCHLLLCYEDGLPHRRESTAPRENGSLHVEIISTPLRDGSGKIIAGIESIRDITQRKEIEKNILRLNEELRHTTQELSARNQNLKTFSYSLSHDLKTPLTIIFGSAQVLSETYSAQLDETGNYLLEQILIAGERMDQLLDAMLQMAHHAQMELQLEKIDLSVMTKEIMETLRTASPERAVHFIAAEGIIREGDPRLIRSVLVNLLNNAWKYTRHTKETVIEFGCEVRDGIESCFVRDNGAGFNMEKHEKLFRPFQRLHSHDEFEGNGVGLATAQQIIHRHGGRIWGEGTLGEGATFYFTL